MEESNTKKLIRSIDKMALKISEQLELIAEDKKNPDGTEVELSNKNVDTFLKMIKDSDKIEKFSEIADRMYGVNTEITTETTTETVVERKTTGNKFEEIQNKIKGNA